MLKNLLSRLLPSSASRAVPPDAVPVPDDVAGADALIAQGNDLEEAGDVVQAEAMYREAVAAAPSHPRAYLNLGVALADKGDQEGAIAAYEQLLAIDPRHPFGNYNFARLAFLRGDYARAETLVAAALQAKPEFAQALVVQSNILDALGKSELAIAAIKAALRLQPDDAGGWFNLALMLQKAGRPGEADGPLARALEGEPDNLAALELSMRILNDHGFAAEALGPVSRIIALDPAAWVARSFELMLMNFVEGIPADDLSRRHFEFGRDLEAQVPARFDRFPERGDPNRPLRIGYVSRDLLMHTVAVFLAPLLEQHDRSQVQVYCYSFGDGEPDRMTERLRKASDHWRDVGGLSDVAFADAIHADGIDVLVDLVGHTGQPRLGVFCQRPAPVQVSWLGYLNTTGLTRMDFRLCDVRTDPPESAQPRHTERLVALPASQWCYRPLVDRAINPVAPFERNGHMTFGSFNAALKVTPAMCRRWARILLRVPGSRLLVVDIKSARKKAAMLQDVTALGVAADRVEFLPRVPLEEYLDLFNRVDVALDSFPYGGGTTTLDSLWMGVPVVATVADTSVSRSAASVLTYLGMPEWIAPSVDDYVDVAVARVSDREALLATRRALRPRMAASPLTDIARFTRDVEAAYRGMWLEKTA